MKKKKREAKEEEEEGGRRGGEGGDGSVQSASKVLRFATRYPIIPESRTPSIIRPPVR